MRKAPPTFPYLFEQEMSDDRKKDRVIIDLSRYGTQLNEIIDNCIDEIESKDDYVKRVKEGLK